MFGVNKLLKEYGSDCNLSPDNVNWPLLGGVRFFLAFVVLAEHLGWFIRKDDPILKFSEFSPLVAVLGFLVISGFSIAASFDAQKQSFYFRRALRIIPIYFFSIVLSEVVDYFLSKNNLIIDSIGGSVDFLLIAGNLFFMQGFFVHSLESNPIVWTLSIEIFFYVLAPYINHRSKWIVFFVVFSLAFFAAHRYLSFSYYSQMLYGLGILFLGWAWLFGYWFYYRRHTASSIYFLTILGVISITINGHFVSDFWTVTWIIPCLVLGYGQFFPFHLSGFLKLLGDLSYPVYLLHIPVFKLVKNFSYVQAGYGYVAAVVIISLLVDRLFDRPLKAYFRRMI